MQDGDDIYPLDAVIPEIYRGTPVIDGSIEADEWAEIIHYPGSPDLSATLYALWDDEYLYYALHVNDDMVQTPWAEPWWNDALYLRIDAMNNGFLAHGQDNYDLWVTPTFPTFEVRIVMPDGSFNEELVLESDLLGAYTRTYSSYTLELGVPTNTQTSLYLYAGLQIGVQAEIVDYDTYPGWPHIPLFTEFIDFTFSPDAGISDPASIAGQYELSLSVAPQPLNPGGIIAYTLPIAGNVELSLWNVLGRKLAVLEEGWKSAGRHQIRWNGRDLASGIYLLRLAPAQGAEDITGKILLLK